MMKNVRFFKNLGWNLLLVSMVLLFVGVHYEWTAPVLWKVALALSLGSASGIARVKMFGAQIQKQVLQIENSEIPAFHHIRLVGAVIIVAMWGILIIGSFTLASAGTDPLVLAFILGCFVASQFTIEMSSVKPRVTGT